MDPLTPEARRRIARLLRQLADELDPAEEREKEQPKRQLTELDRADARKRLRGLGWKV